MCVFYYDGLANEATFPKVKLASRFQNLRCFITR